MCTCVCVFVCVCVCVCVCGVWVVGVFLCLHRKHSPISICTCVHTRVTYTYKKMYPHIFVSTHIITEMYFYLDSSCWSCWASSAFITSSLSRFTSPPRNCSDGGGGWTLRISACGGSVWLRVRKFITVLLLDMSVDPNVCVWCVCVCAHMYICLYMYCYTYMCRLSLYIQTHINIRVYVCVCDTVRQCQ